MNTGIWLFHVLSVIGLYFLSLLEHRAICGTYSNDPVPACFMLNLVFSFHDVPGSDYGVKKLKSKYDCSIKSSMTTPRGLEALDKHYLHCPSNGIGITTGEDYEAFIATTTSGNPPVCSSQEPVPIYLWDNITKITPYELCIDTDWNFTFLLANIGAYLFLCNCVYCCFFSNECNNPQRNREDNPPVTTGGSNPGTIATLRNPKEGGGVGGARVKLFLSRQRPESRIPRAFICPITQELMIDPTIYVEDDGHTYERKAILKWILEHPHGPTPLSGKIGISSSTLQPNINLKQAIESWKDKQKATTPRRRASIP